MRKPPLKPRCHYLKVWLARIILLTFVIYESWSQIRDPNRVTKTEIFRAIFPLALNAKEMSDLFLVWHYTKLLFALIHSVKPHGSFENKVLRGLLLAEAMFEVCTGGVERLDQAYSLLFVVLSFELEHFFHKSRRHRHGPPHHMIRPLDLPEVKQAHSEEEEPRGRTP